MKQNINLSVSEIVGTQLSVASQDGQKVHDRIATALNAGSNVSISFLNVSILTAAFLNAAIGKLYGSFTESHIRSKLKLTDVQPDDLALLKRVIETAQQYFKDPKRFNKAFRDAIAD